MMNRPAGVIFDCDGTLVDSEGLGNEVFADMLSQFGLHMSAQQALTRFRGARLAQTIASVEAELGEELPADFVPAFRARSAEAFRERLREIPGALDLVRSLDMPICVASSGPRDKMELNLGLTGLMPYFAGRVFSSYDYNTWKPEPGIFLHAATAIGAPIEQCLVVEDSMPGIQAGLAAGASVIALQTEAVDPRIPENVRTIQSLRQLQELLR